MKAIRVTQIWVVDPFTQVKSAELMQKLFNTNLKSVAQADLKMYKMSKIKYSQIRHFLDHRVQNVPENSSKLHCLVAFQNRPSALISCDENFLYFEFLEGQFYRKKPSFVK